MKSKQTKRILAVFGTRPEAIKMAPVIKALKQSAELDVKVCVTAQHREMLDQVLRLFNVEPDYDLNIMRPGQELSALTSSMLVRLHDVIKEVSPDVVLVHGDTTTTFVSSLAAFYEKIPVGHVEAGLRTGNIYAPWPEEMNRRLAGTVSTWHFAPTAQAADNLYKEGVSEDSVYITGNTVIDALLEIVSRLDKEWDLYEQAVSSLPSLDNSRRLILVTGHRRESFGEGFKRICQALSRLAERDDVEIVYPVHLNPNVQGPVYSLLGGRQNVHLIEPLDYLPFVALMKKSYLIITDSGGIQEEAPSLGKPVFVMRDITERPEAVEAGTVRLVGTNEEAIVSEVSELLTDDVAYACMARAHNPYGDGLASQRILSMLTGHNVQDWHPEMTKSQEGKA